MPSRYGLCLSPQRVTAEALRTVWVIADQAGFDSCWTSDHFLPGGDPVDGDVLEAWTQLGAMAEATRQVRIGTLVTGNTYRHPGVLAKMAVTVDRLSGGRLEVGLGAGWDEREHGMLGLEFGTLRERMDRLEESCQILLSLWTRPVTTFAGRHYRLDAAVAEPKPVQRPHPPLWIGGTGRTRTLRIAAAYADAWNMPRGTVEEFRELCSVLDEHCASIGRDPRAVRRSVTVRFTDDPEDLVPLAEAFAAAGAEEIIVTLRFGQEPVAERVAGLLPKLRSIG